MPWAFYFLSDRLANIDTRARGITDFLKRQDGFVTTDEIARATRINKSNVDDAVSTLYNAGMVETLPGNRVRLINQKEAAGPVVGRAERTPEGARPDIPQRIENQIEPDYGFRGQILKDEDREQGVEFRDRKWHSVQENSSVKSAENRIDAAREASDEKAQQEEESNVQSIRLSDISEFQVPEVQLSRLKTLQKGFERQDPITLAQNADSAVRGDTGLMEANFEGVELLGRALSKVYDKPYDIGGTYLRRNVVQKVRSVLHDWLMQFRRAHNYKASLVIEGLLRSLDAAIDPKYGDVAIAIYHPDFPEYSKHVAQEELIHRTNERTDTRRFFTEEFAKIPAIARDLQNLRGYEDFDLAGKLDEVVAKNFREDAERQLNKTSEQVDESLDVLLTYLDKMGVDLEEYARQIETISPRGERFAGKARELTLRSRQGLGETRPDGAEKGNTPPESPPASRQHRRHVGSRMVD